MNRDWIMMQRWSTRVRRSGVATPWGTMCALIVVMCALLASCSGQGAKQTEGQETQQRIGEGGKQATEQREGLAKAGTLQLVATIAPTSALVEAIAGGTAQAHTLLPQGNTPETYEPTPKDMATLARASAYIYVGNLGFERSWLSRIADLYPNLRLISTAPAHDGQACSSHERASYEHDPHYWMGIRGIRSMARQVYDVLRSSAPQHEGIYRNNYTALSHKIDSLETEVRQLLASAPSRAFVIYHPSLTDFADEHGYTQLIIEQDGKEPTPQQLASLIDRAKAMRVKTVFIQREFDQKLARSVAEELGARCVEINPLSGDWAGQLRLVARSLSQP